jgi:hypothetical protein
MAPTDPPPGYVEVSLREESKANFGLVLPKNAMHVLHSYLQVPPWEVVAGAYYVKENEAHGYTKVCLTANAASLAPEGLLESCNNVGGWKAIIRQLEDQLAAGEVEPEVVAAQVAGLMEFAN